MRRRCLYAALLLLATGLAGWAGRVLGQGEGDGDGSGRGIIAKSKPVMGKTQPAVVEMDQEAGPAARRVEFSPPASPATDDEPPPIPQSQGIKPIVPLPDDNMGPIPPPPKRPVPLRFSKPDSRSKVIVPVASTVEIEAGAVALPGSATRIPEDKNRRELRAARSPLGVTDSLPGAQTANVTVEAVGPASVNPGQTYAYEIVVRNSGPAKALQVRVEEEKSAGARYLTIDPRPTAQTEVVAWELGDLEAGQERRLRIQVEAPLEGEVVSAARATFTTSSSLKTRIARPQLAVTATGPDNAQIGDPVNIPIKLSNPGTGTAMHIKLQARLPEGLQHPAGDQIEADAGTLSPGQSRTFMLQAKAAHKGKQVVQVSVQAEGCQSKDVQAVVLVTEAALQVRVTGVERGLVNQEAAFQMEVSNPGSAPATNVRLTAALPVGLDFISADGGAVPNDTARTVEWRLDTLPAGKMKTISLKLRTGSAGERVVQALAQADRDLLARGALPVKIEGVVGLTLEVTAKDNPLEVGAETSYEVHVVNQGSAACTNLMLLAVVPDGLAPLKGAGPVNHRLLKHQVAFAPLPRLDPGTDARFTIRVQAKKSGDWRLKAQITCDQLQGPVSKEESTHVYND